MNRSSWIGSIPHYILPEFRCQYLVLQTNGICLVDGANTHRGDSLLILVHPFLYLSFIIPIENKPWNMNWLDLFCQKFISLSPNFFPSWLIGEKLHMLLPYLHRFHMVWVPQSYREQPPSLLDFSAASYLLRCWITRACDWTFFCHRWGVSSCASCVSYSSILFLLTRDFSGFVSFPLFTNDTPLLSF